MTNPSSEPLSSQADNEAEGLIDWGIVFQILYDSSLKILIATLIALIIGIIYSARLPNVYTATTNLRVEMLNDYSDVIYKEFSAKFEGEDRLTYYGTQLELLQSDTIIGETVKDLHLRERFHFETTEQAILKLKEQINVSLIHGTEILSIVVNDHDPKMAAAIANTIAKNYIKMSSENRVRVPKELMKMISSNGEILVDSEFLNQPQPGTNEAHLTALPTLTQDPILTKLKQDLLDVQDQIKLLSSRYTPAYPEIVALNQKEGLLEQQISARTKHLLDALASVIKGDFNVNNVTVVEKAFPPRFASGPKRKHITFLITIAGFAASVCFIIFFSYIHRKVERAEDLRLIPDVAFLGYVPEIFIPKQEKENSRQYIIKQLHMDFRLSDSIHDIRNNLLFSMPKGKNKTVLCCSLLPDEGKSVVSCMLALSMASVGEKILLIDADMRDPSIHLSFGQENTFGFSNALVGMNSWKLLLKTVEDVPNLKVLCAGSSAPNSTALLSTPQLVKMIGEMKEEFDHIIFDAPPLLQIPDAFVISEKIDGMVFIIKAGSVEVSLIDQINRKIKSLKINLVGLILNKVNLKKVFKGYYQSYYGSYGNKKNQ